MTKDNYPFVTPKIANLAKKYGFDEQCFGVYEKGHTWNNKKIKAKLFRSDLNIKNAIEVMKDSRVYEAYLKRPGMFDGKFALPIWMIKAPLYSQLIDWFYYKKHIFIEVSNGHYEGQYDYALYELNYKYMEYWKVREGYQNDSPKKAMMAGVSSAFNFLKSKCDE